MRRVTVLPVTSALAGAAVATATPATAHHSWASYHWARGSGTFTVQLGDNVSASWDSYLKRSSADWSSASQPLTTALVAGGTTGKRCQPTAGRVEVCNAAYGKTGWLGSRRCG